MRQKLTGAGFGQTHQVFNLHVMVQFRLFICGKGRLLLSLGSAPEHASARGLGSV